ncbi:MAG: outer membrane protein assembly factor BamA [Deltaproteobacteria bacterium]|nr:outer membrane protein assembly factor BamA [Deltaproteobacteria bacterium]
MTVRISKTPPPSPVFRLKKTQLFVFIIFILIFPIATQPALSNDEILLREIHITTPQNEFDTKTWDNLFPFKKGDRVSKQKLEDRISAINQLNLFQTIEYQLKELGKNTYELDVKIDQAPKVRDINVKGNYPFLAKDIRRLVSIQSGDVFEKSELRKSETIITEYLEKHGFYGSTVSISKRKQSDKGYVDLLVDLDKGKTYRVGEITVKGNHFLKTNRIKNKISRFGRFRIERFKKDIKKIKELYRKKGFIKARVKTEDLAYNSKTEKVGISIQVRENRKLTLFLSGESRFSLSRLKPVMGLEKRRSYDRVAIANAKNRLKRFYQLKGYPNAQIKSKIEKPDDHQVHVYLEINAGKRVLLKDIQFDGNDEIGKQKLQKNIDSVESGLFSNEPFNQRQLIKDQLKLAAYYKGQGFFDSEIKTPEVEKNHFGDQVTVSFPISEGQQYSIGSITLASEDKLDTEKLLKVSKLKTKDDYKAEDIQEATLKLKEHFEKQGHAYVEIKNENIVNREQKTVSVIFHIQKGPIVRVRKILLKGNFQTKSKIIRRHLKLKEGELFVFQDMLDGQLNLRRLGVFSSVRATPLGFDQRQTELDVLVSVIERKPVVVELSAGFDSRNLATGELNFTKYNLFGSARQLSTRVIGGLQYSRAELTFYSPRIFGASWNLANQYFGQYENTTNFNAYSYGGFINTLKNFGPHWTFGFKEQITRTEVLESESNVAALGNALFDNTFNEFQVSLIFDARDNFSDPQKGVYILARNEWNTDLSDVTNNFNTVELNASHYLGFLKRFTLVNTLRYGHTFGLGTTPRIPVNKLFFLGGSDTLRGFTEDGVNPSGGTVQLIYNGELQFAFTESVKVAGFFDAGVLQNDIQAIQKSDVRESAGMGLRYFTPIGPLRLDWGFILDRKSGEPQSRLHFSFGYFF